MQPKVSIVMPCYNKERYIGDMFASVLQQDWDNIELVLVNDGSTDGTRGVIAEWEPKFAARGFSAVVIDQQNSGVCAAEKAGMQRATGDFFCTIDADDALDARYVSTLAGFLQQNPDYDWAACNFEAKNREDATSVPWDAGIFPTMPGDENFLENLIARRVIPVVWIYMVRMSYLKKCDVAGRLYTERRKGSHEPGYVIPLAGGGGKLKYFPDKKLYLFNTDASEHSMYASFADARRFLGDTLFLKKQALQTLDVPPQRLAWLENLADYVFLAQLLRDADTLAVPEEERRAVNGEMADLLNRWLCPKVPVAGELLFELRKYFVFTIVENRLFGGEPLIPHPAGKIVGCGVLGKKAQVLLAEVMKTGLAPTVLWDGGADGTQTVMGMPVEKPAPETLCEDDAVLIFPMAQQASESIRASLAGAKTGRIYDNRAMWQYLSVHYFGPHVAPGKGEGPCSRR